MPPTSSRAACSTYIEMEKALTIACDASAHGAARLTIGQSVARSRHATVFGLMSPGEPFEYTPGHPISAEDVLVVGGDAASWSASPTAREPAWLDATTRVRSPYSETCVGVGDLRHLLEQGPGASCSSWRRGRLRR